MRKWLVLFPVLMMAATLWAAPQDAQPTSLGDLARQQKAKEKEKPAKVFTNDNLPANDGSITTGATGGTVVAPPSAAAEGAPAAAASGKAAATAPKGKVDEEKVKEAQRKLDGLKNDMANLDKNYKMLEEKIANTTDDFQRQVYQNSLETRDSESAALQQRIAAAQQELEAAQKGEPTGASAPAPPAAPPPAAENPPESGPPQ